MKVCTVSDHTAIAELSATATTSSIKPWLHAPISLSEVLLLLVIHWLVVFVSGDTAIPKPK